MKCPECDSESIQRDRENAFALGRLAGVRKLYCKGCGHTFRAFDPLGKVGRSKPDKRYRNRRLSPRYPTHLPTEISLIETIPKQGKATYSAPSRGHCESINRFGMGLSLVGSRFPEEELTRIGGLLFVRVKLPEVTLEAVVSIVNHQRIGEAKKRKWFLGVKIHQLSETDQGNLLAFLEDRSLAQPLLVSEEEE
jgi:hypothetical protein